MKIALILRKKFPGENSMEELARSLERNMPELTVYELPCYSSNPFDMVKNIKYVRKIKADLFHIFTMSDAYIAPFVRNAVITCHDVFTLKLRRSRIKTIMFKFFNMDMPYLFIKKLICISSVTANDMVGYCRKYRKKIVVIPNPLNENIGFSYKEFDTKKPVILHIGTAPRKNLPNVLRALKGIECKIIIVGILNQEEKELLAENKIEYENYVDIPFQDVISLYSSCDIVSFPSSKEGFGMPLIEANKVGRPVLGSSIDIFKEIAPECYCQTDENSVQSLRDGFVKIINDEKYREKLINNGIANVKKYDVLSVTSELRKLYQSIIE